MDQRKTENRVYDKKVEIDHDKIKSFFNKRAKNADGNSILSSTMFTEKEKAEKRDLLEKKLFLDNIDIISDSKVLDIGCGVGRWAELFSNNGKYLGLDYSDELLNIATKNNSADHIHFQLMSADDIKIDRLLITPPFDIIIITGLLIYINDEQLDKVFQTINNVSSEGTILYLREAVAINERLTLKEFYSNELNDDYSAIYRTETDYFKLFDSLEEFKLLKSGNVYDKTVHDRAETVHKYYILKRG